MSEYVQKGYIRIADIIPILDDMRIADIPKLSKIVDEGSVLNRPKDLDNKW